MSERLHLNRALRRVHLEREVDSEEVIHDAGHHFPTDPVELDRLCAGIHPDRERAGHVRWKVGKYRGRVRRCHAPVMLHDLAVVASGREDQHAGVAVVGRIVVVIREPEVKLHVAAHLLPDGRAKLHRKLIGSTSLRECHRVGAGKCSRQHTSRLRPKVSRQVGRSGAVRDRPERVSELRAKERPDVAGPVVLQHRDFCQQLDRTGEFRAHGTSQPWPTPATLAKFGGRFRPNIESIRRGVRRLPLVAHSTVDPRRGPE